MRKIFSCELSAMASFKMFRSKYASTEFDCRQSRLSRVATTTAAAATTLADLVWGFSGPAAVRPGRWIGGFPGRRRSGRVGVGLGVFPAGGGPAGTALDWGFSGIARDFSRFAVTEIRAVSAGSSGFGL